MNSAFELVKDLGIAALMFFVFSMASYAILGLAVSVVDCSQYSGPVGEQDTPSTFCSWFYEYEDARSLTTIDPRGENIAVVSYAPGILLAVLFLGISIRERRTAKSSGS